MSHQELNWRRILKYIETEQAAVLIGPNACLLDGKPIHYMLESSILENHSDGVVYYYEKDGLFLFQDKIVKNDVAQDIRIFYEESDPDYDIFKKLGQIKFHLYLSMNPDTYLSDTFYKYGIKHRFNYFRRHTASFSNQRENFKEVEIPNQDNPLIYNIFGSKQDDESLILDYEDVFNLISTATNPDGLPEKLRVALQKVRLFIFVGFSFNKWYTQLLLRLLCGSNETAKYAANRQRLEDSDIKNFLVHQFNISFLTNSFNFLDELYDNCKNSGLLRSLSSPFNSTESAIARHVQNGEVNQAIDKLSTIEGDVGFRNECLTLHARYSHWRDQKEKGILDTRDALVEYNRIVDNIIHLVRSRQPV